MREYKFRGKRVDIDNNNCDWIYGDLISTDPYRIANLKLNKDSYVISSTIGQYTGLKDKNDVEIYEGDIVWVADRICKICWFEPQATFDMEFIKYIEKSSSEWKGCSNNQWVYLCEVIGNIYDNPELLEH